MQLDGDPAFGAELVDSYNQLRRKVGQFRSDGVFSSVIADMHPLNAFTGGVDFEPISVIAKPLFLCRAQVEALRDISSLDPGSRGRKA